MSALRLSLPQRTAICLECRLLLCEGERCDFDPAHRVAPMRTAEGEGALLEVAWPGAAPRRARGDRTTAGRGRALAGAARQVAFMTSVPVIFLSVFLIAGAVWGGVLAAVGTLSDAMLLPSGLVFALGATAIAIALCRRARRRIVAASAGVEDERLLPRGAKERSLESEAPLRGVVREGGPSMLSPTGIPCIGFAISLRHSSAAPSPVMLRDGVAAGCEVELESGERVRLPASRLRLEARGERAPIDIGTIDVYLNLIDPRRYARHALDPFAHDEIEEVLLRPGDEVEVLSPLDRAEGGWLAPAGLPALRKITP